MADRKSLGVFGLVFGVVTVVVMLVAAVAVQAQIDGRPSPGGASPQFVAAPALTLSR
jgi:hypothetical protein